MQPSNRIAKSIVSVLRHFKWNRVVVLAGENFMYIKNAFQVREIIEYEYKKLQHLYLSMYLELFFIGLGCEK